MAEEEQVQMLESQLLQFCQENMTDGVADEALRAKFPSFPLAQQAQAINNLLSKGRLSIHKLGNTLIYKATNAEDSAKFADMKYEDMLIYQLIEQSGNMGIWTRDLKRRSSIQQTQITKILKALESRKLVKCVKSVQSKNKKVYMLYDIEPSREVTGGVWYQGDEFDSEFIEVLNSRCHDFIENKKYASLDEIVDYVKSCGWCTVELRPEDVESIILTLVCDGKVEEVVDSRGAGFLSTKQQILYKPSRMGVPHNFLTDIPCASCPVSNVCSDQGDITPAKCEYMKKWLAF